MYVKSVLKNRSRSFLLAAPDGACMFTSHIPLNFAAIARPDGILVRLESSMSSLASIAGPRCDVPIV